MNKAEELVADLCTRSFLSLWSYPNPRKHNSYKELCDVLVVCDPDIIIFSVKETTLKENANLSLEIERWHKRAIQESVKQLYGAERHLTVMTEVVTKEGRPGVPLPNRAGRHVHRIAVALGGKGSIPVSFQDFGKGLVHVFDEISLLSIMKELDTVADFVGYLSDKETLYRSGIRIELNGGEEDLLAAYLHNGRKFAQGHNPFVLDEGLWSAFVSKPEYRAKKREDKISHVWDRLIEIFCHDFLTCGLEFGNSLTDMEQVVRTMAREDRFCRRLMGKSFIEFYEQAGQKKVRARMVISPSGIVYVFLARPHGEVRESRVTELGARCFVARGSYPDHPKVIGIATEQYEKDRGFSLDAYYLFKENWTAEDQKHAEYCKREFGFFSAPRIANVHEDEYPQR